MDQSFILKRLEKFEGRVRHMYRCTGGEVTIGIGHAILRDLDALPLRWAIDGRAATPAEIHADYGAVNLAAKGMVASKYATLSTCRMADADIDALAASDVRLFAEKLAAAIPKFGGYPECIQAALFDMAFNLGVGGLLKFRKVLTACEASDWETAAKECHRIGIGEVRNLETAALFRQALTPATKETHAISAR